MSMEMEELFSNKEVINYILKNIKSVSLKIQSKQTYIVLQVRIKSDAKAMGYNGGKSINTGLTQTWY